MPATAERLTMAKPLLAGLTYPYDWGFIPSTKAEDGDPLDVLIIHDAATYPGLVLTCKPIGILEVLQTSEGKKERNDRVFAVPERSPFEGELQDVRHLPARAMNELEKFFSVRGATVAGPDSDLSASKLPTNWFFPGDAQREMEELPPSDR